MITPEKPTKFYLLFTDFFTKNLLSECNIKLELKIMVNINMDIDIKEKLQWFQILNTLYEIAMPRIEAFIGIQCKAIEERIVDVEAVGKNTQVLRQLLAVIKIIPEPPAVELDRTKKYFETALTNCINGSEALIKYVQCSKDEAEFQTHLDCLINSLVMAREYAESTYSILNTVPK